MEYIFEEIRVRTFKTQVRRSIEGFDGYNETIREVIVEAKKLSLNEIDIYSVKRELFPMVMHLSIYGRTILPQIENIDILRSEDLKALLSVF